MYLCFGVLGEGGAGVDLEEGLDDGLDALVLAGEFHELGVG